MREIKGWLKWFISVVLAGLALFNLYTAIFGVFQPRIQRGALMIVVLPMAFLLFPATKKSPKDRPSILDVILALLAVLPPVFVMYYNDQLNMRFELVDPISTQALLLGLLNIGLIIEALRRAVVPMMAIFVSVFLGYLFVAPYMSGVFYSKPMPIERIVEINYLITNAGIYGSIVGVTATFVAIFVIFGSFMQNTNTGAYFTNLACKLAGNGPGGPAKIAVISSGLFGSISGVAAANVYATGVFTIPLMKRLGYKKKFAGAVEAAASTGGMLMPPVMGAGAFVMSEITGIPYIRIVVAALLGATFYYISLVFRVHFYAKKHNLGGVSEEEQVSTRQLLIDSYQLIPLVLLVVMLVIGYSPFVAAIWAIAGTFVLSFVNRKTWLTPKKLFETFRLAGQNMIMLALSCAGADMIVSIVTYTGLALGISAVISTWSGGILLPALMLIMFTSLLLGMGLPCTPAYIIAVTIGGPALQAMGVGLLQAHLFVFYFAILAGVTPPVCIAAYCAASIAESQPFQTGFEALRLASVGFIIPYIFIFNPALLMQGTFMEIVTIIIIIFPALIFTAGGMRGYLLRTLKVHEQFLSLIVAFGLILLSTQKELLSSPIVEVSILVTGVFSLLVLFILHRRVMIRNSAVSASQT
ncbi:MAG: C4-dicarboxylate ABC transporter permease [Spirochaetes bacterium]|nr:MAG: C4-dicarboxylate ABC transporter permease [Spirochaetota bacterium]